MELYELEDVFYPMMMQIYQAKYLVEDIQEHSPCCIQGEPQRYFAYTDLLQDVLRKIVEKAETIQTMMDHA